MASRSGVRFKGRMPGTSGHSHVTRLLTNTETPDQISTLGGVLSHKGSAGRPAEPRPKGVWGQSSPIAGSLEEADDPGAKPYPRGRIVGSRLPVT